MRYNRINRHGGLIVTVAMLLAMVISIGCASAGFAIQYKHVDGNVAVSAVSGSIDGNIDLESSKVEVSSKKSSPAFDIELNGLDYPGAYALVSLKVRNTGSLPATLVEIKRQDPDLPFISMELPENLKVGEVVKPNGECIFQLVIKWDPESDFVPDKVLTTTFGVTLVYENDDMEEDKDSGKDTTERDKDEDGGKGEPKPPKTSDNTNATALFIVSGVSAVFVIGCLFMILIGKRKKEEEDPEQ